MMYLAKDIKVKIFRTFNDYGIIEENINKFLNEISYLIDIKYTVVRTDSENVYSVLIIYK